MADLSHARDRMVEIQIAGRGVRDRGVLEAMRAVPREAFVAVGSENSNPIFSIPRRVCGKARNTASRNSSKSNTSAWAASTAGTTSGRYGIARLAIP